MSLPEISVIDLDSPCDSTDSEMATEAEVEAEEFTEHHSIPKDADYVNVNGRLVFDEEAAPDQETRENTEYNSMSYIFNHEGESSSAEDLSKPKKTPHTKRVILNTCTPNADVRCYELDFIQQSQLYQYSSHSRTILVGWVGDDLSTRALKWAMAEFINDNDTLVVIEVIPLQFIVKNGIKDHYVKHEARFNLLKTFNVAGKKLRLIYQIHIGNAKYFIDKAISDHEADMYIMGYSGGKRSVLGGILNEDTSMEKHYLDHGKIPVIMVNNTFQVATPPSSSGGGISAATKINENTFVDKIKMYPSVYNPKTHQEANALESVLSNGSDDSSPSRTSRFLRAGRSMARSVSRNVSNERSSSPFGIFRRKA